MAMFTVEVRRLFNVGGDWRYRRIGVIDSYLNLDVIVRYNAVGSWSLQLPTNAPQAGLLTPGAGVIVWLDGMSAPVLSGPLRAIERNWSEDDSGPGSVTYSGVCDNTVLAERVCMPSPGQGLTSPTGGAGYRQPAAYFGANTPYSAERMVHELAYVNLGPGAWSPRRALGFHHASPASWPAANSSPLTTFKLRFEPVLEALQARVESAMDGTGRIPMGFRWVWDAATEKVKLDIYRPDQTPDGKVRFSRDIGNLRTYNYKLNAPKANWFVMGLRNDDDVKPQWQDLWIGDRTSDTPEWGMLAESYKDHGDLSFFKRDADDLPIWPNGAPHPQIDWDAINAALTQDALDDGHTASLSVEPINTVGCRVGSDYWLGDRVTVSVDGADIKEVLREIHLSDGPDGPVVAPTIGTPDASETPGLYKDVRRLWQSVRRLQRLQGGRK